MKRTIILVCLLAACGFLALAAGCTSSVPVNATQTPAPSVSTSLRDLVLTQADLPPGYSIVYRGEMAPPNQTCNPADLCFIRGYFTSADNGQNNTSSNIDIALLSYNRNPSATNLEDVFADQLPEIANGNITRLADPGIGDVSALYEFPLPGVPQPSYLIVFGKGRFYEMILVNGPDASANLVTSLARKAVAKLP